MLEQDEPPRRRSRHIQCHDPRSRAHDYVHQYNRSREQRRKKNRVRRLSKMSATIAVALALSAPFARFTSAQSSDVGATIEAAATALGMVRGTARRMDSINTIQFSGHGFMRVAEPGGAFSRLEITELTAGISYSIPAMRWDTSGIGPDGREQRSIHVVRGDRAWDEQLPGVGPTEAAGQARRRSRQIWLTPHGVITAAVHDRDSTVLGSRAGRTTLTIEIDGTPVTATLDDESRPASVEMPIDHPVLGPTLLEASYMDYVDWPILDVYFPSRIVQRLGGETTLDVTVTEFFQNPYVVFPTPEQLSRSLQ